MGINTKSSAQNDGVCQNNFHFFRKVVSNTSLWWALKSKKPRKITPNIEIESKKGEYTKETNPSPKQKRVSCLRQFLWLVRLVLFI